MLECLDTDLIWQTVWDTTGYSLSDFEKIIITLDDNAFLHDTFQFRFHNEATLSGNFDHWHLDNVLLTPTTKAESDELIDKETIISNNIMTEDEWHICENYAHDLFRIGTELMEERGMILVDTKYEFGKTKSGEIILVDEVHTPDSSRFWIKHSYESRFLNKEEPEMIDKEFVRKWVKKTYPDPYNEPNIVITDDMRLRTLNKYLQLYEIITGEELSLSV